MTAALSNGQGGRGNVLWPMGSWPAKGDVLPDLEKPIKQTLQGAFQGSP